MASTGTFSCQPATTTWSAPLFWSFWRPRSTSLSSRASSPISAIRRAVWSSARTLSRQPSRSLLSHKRAPCSWTRTKASSRPPSGLHCCQCCKLPTCLVMQTRSVIASPDPNGASLPDSPRPSECGPSSYPCRPRLPTSTLAWSPWSAFDARECTTRFCPAEGWTTAALTATAASASCVATAEWTLGSLIAPCRRLSEHVASGSDSPQRARQSSRPTTSQPTR